MGCDQKGFIITHECQNFLDESGRKPNKIWVDQGDKFYNRSISYGCMKMALKCIQHTMKENLLLQKDLSKL